ncbi:uncharacterized protein LOC143217888 [Lasioglossum baleicum]|uniref:uncharacterized protein LOC143217888 n=1 Tax=Lasioglossum baleicum TaxID=434251 RepID=UPI003FCD8121
MSLPSIDERIAQLEAKLAAHREAASSSSTDSYRAPKLPVFFKREPKIWFGQVEATFRNARITSQTAMADALIAGLDSETAVVISDLIITPDPVAPYTRIKERIMAMFFTESDLRQLLKGLVASHGKPSDTLAIMRSLNNGVYPESVLRSIFLDLMAEQCRAILAASTSDDLQELALLADKIFETINSAAVHAGAAATTRSSSIQEQIDQLTREVASLKASNKRASRSRQRNFSQSADGSRSRRHSRSRDPSGFCRIHAKYGERAIRCIKPCAWSGLRRAPGN